MEELARASELLYNMQRKAMVDELRELAAAFESRAARASDGQSVAVWYQAVMVIRERIADLEHLRVASQ